MTSSISYFYVILQFLATTSVKKNVETFDFYFEYLLMIGSTNLEILINKLCVVQFSDIIVNKVPFLVLSHAGSHVWSGTAI